MSTDERSGLDTPPFGQHHTQGRPYFTHPGGSIGGYTAADFPAPPGVPLVTENRPAPMATKPRRGIGTVIGTAALAAVIGAGAGVGSYATLVTDGVASAPISVSTVPAAQSPVLDGTVAAAAAKIEPSVVTISVQSGTGGDIGSGVVLDADGHVLTNHHVVEAAGADGVVRVTFGDGKTAEARVVGFSEANDLAVVKVSGVSDLTPATFAKSSALQVGQSVVAAGAPLGLSESVTSGIVSNTARPVRSGTNDDAVYLAVQTDAAINPGNSGGPLVDLNGAVVGINSSIASTGSGSQGSQSGNIGIGFAIPSDVAVRVAAELIASGRSPNAALGVTVAGNDSAVSTSTGVSLQSVTSGGAAAEAGLQAGDVVTKVNDFETTTADGLIAATRFYAPGTEVRVTYTRDGGAPQTVTVTLGTQ
jgi:putative serine protease PepD